MRTHLCGGRQNVRSFGGIGSHLFSEVVQHRLRVPDGDSLGTREKLRLSLI